ncbi:MAG: hypothetical protein E7469_07690 [Ruminococcaceae bacterium]|nr:hypothetical protein [Oscillospiraceae bacterium]
MKMKWICLLLTLCLLLTACAKKPPKDETPDEPPVVGTEDGEQNQQPDTPPQDGEQGQEGEEQTPAGPPYAPLKTLTAGEERISGAAAKQMSAGMEQPLLDLVDCYYRSLSKLAVQDCRSLFTTKAESDWHKHEGGIRLA